MGLVRPAAGTVEVDGKDVTRWPTERRVREARLVLCPEGRHVFASQTVLENLQLGAVSARDPAAETLELVFDLFPELKPRTGQLAGTLSGTQQQILDISPQPMARIGCWPTDSVPASCPVRGFSSGNRSKTSSSVSAAGSRAETAPSWRFSSTVWLAKTCRPSGQSTSLASRTRRSVGQRVTSLPSTSTVPAAGRTKPMMALHTVLLPAPLGPRRATASPAWISKSTPVTALAMP